MSQVFLYSHGGSGNHGCEAIVRSTIKLFNKKDIVLVSSRPDDDIKYGISNICEVIKERSDRLNKTDTGFWKAYLALKLKKDFIPMDKLWYKEAFDHIISGDLAISVGGDNYCYTDVNKYVMFHDMLRERGAKTILWACSIEPDVIKQSSISKDLARYDLITARETITYEALRQVNPNTILVSDPAFHLGANETDIPDHFVTDNTVGINLSPMVIENETVAGMTWANYISLIDYILLETDMNIALIPHVIWEQSDDRVPLRKLYNKYKTTNRVCIIEDRGCEELKFLISKCKFFIGARTHATIAAYSTKVPTLVLGYSVKSVGIAKDLFGTDSGYVLPVQNLRSDKDLLEHFQLIVKNESDIRNHLSDVLPKYIWRGLDKVDLVMKQ